MHFNCYNCMQRQVLLYGVTIGFSINAFGLNNNNNNNNNMQNPLVYILQQVK